jgi:hypothetical protein
MMGFRAGINSAFTLRSGTGTWIEDDAELSELALQRRRKCILDQALGRHRRA